MFGVFLSSWSFYNVYLIPVQQKTNAEVEKNEILRRRIRDLKQQMSRLKHIRQQQVTWTSRAVLSETKRPIEMLYVATVIRNRVENRWRGHSTYKGVVLDPYQFSAFNTENKYEHLTFEEAKTVAWKISDYVLSRHRHELPFSRDVTHFYSPRSMRGSPMWVSAMHEEKIDIISNNRFRFYK